MSDAFTGSVAGRNVLEALHLFAMPVDDALDLISRQRFAPLIELAGPEKSFALDRHLDAAVALFHARQRRETRMIDGARDARPVFHTDELGDASECLGRLFDQIFVTHEDHAI